jgi:hypothetical protein
MIERIKAWYQAAIAWMGLSEPGGRKEILETSLTEARLKSIIERQVSHKESGRGRFAQVLRGGGTPSDRTRGFTLGFAPPAWADFSIDEWEGPAGKGFILNFWVTETDSTEWVMRVRWNDGDGNDFAIDPWEQIVEVPVP